MMLRTASTLLFALIVVTTADATTREEQNWPEFAFNGGTYDPTIAQAEADSQQATIVQDGNLTTIEQGRIEVFQPDQAATRKQQVSYAVVTSTFTQTWMARNIQYQLSNVAVEYVVLNFEGKLVTATTRRFQMTQNRQWVWASRTEPGRSISTFFCTLPQAQRAYLEATAGYLYENPGRPPVPFDSLSKRLAALLPFIPSPQGYILGVAENLVTDRALKLLASSQVKWGTAIASVHSTRSSYRLTGETVLNLRQARCDADLPDPPSNVGIQ